MGNPDNKIKETQYETIKVMNYAQGKVRMRLMGFSDTERDDKGQPILEEQQHVIMPIQGFLESFGVMQDLFNKLLEAGILKRNPPKAEGDQENTQSVPVSEPEPHPHPNTHGANLQDPENNTKQKSHDNNDENFGVLKRIFQKGTRNKSKR
ncbi:MAG: hypothetical protein HQL64_15885 [Magnetococcales bacterium]|nr:hypothetical protein [Magnetococcales bacterium]